MNQYTVMLMRPAVIQDPALYNDFYLAHVEAENVQKSVYAAQDQAMAADANEVEGFEDYDLQPYDYSVISVFEGHLKPVWVGR